MGAADWDSTLQRAASTPGGVPKREAVVGSEGTRITLGDTTVDVIATPGHTPGTLSYIFPVRDKGRSMVVAYTGGTAFNFPRRAENFAIYRDSQRKMAKAAAAASATVVMSNHTEFDRAYDRARIAQLARTVGEKHPYRPTRRLCCGISMSALTARRRSGCRCSKTAIAEVPVHGLVRSEVRPGHCHGRCALEAATRPWVNTRSVPESGQRLHEGL